MSHIIRPKIGSRDSTHGMRFLFDTRAFLMFTSGDAFLRDGGQVLDRQSQLPSVVDHQKHCEMAMRRIRE